LTLSSVYRIVEEAKLLNNVTPTGLKKRFNKRQSLIPRTDPDTGNPLSTQPPVLPASGQASAKPNSEDTLEKRRRLVLFLALALVFIRFSMIHQILEHLLHRDTYLLYFVGIPVLIGIPLVGGLKRPFEYRSAMCWTAFALWMIPTSAFSTWRGGSVSIITGYYRMELVLLFAIGGLVTAWRECRWLLYTISAAALVNIISVLLFRQLDEDGRTSLTFGTVANSNDYSAHLIFVLPFLLWVMLITKSRYLSIAGFVVLASGLFEILAAGSRGAMLGLVTAILVFAFTTTARVRRIVLVMAPILAALVIALLPSSVVHRIFLFSADNSEISAGAIESSQNREQLLKDSIRTAIQNPLLGVGPGQFSNYEGKQTAKSGQTIWLEAHNSFAQIASENGFPGLIFYLAGILSSLFLLNKTARLFVGRPDVEEASAAILCLRIGLISFCVAIFFTNFGYFFYLPAMAGIAIAVATSTKQLVTPPTGRKKKRKSKKPSNPLLKLSREIVGVKK
jgi:O-antigen ligase